MGIFNFIIDAIDAIVDIWETWKEKDDKILTKLVFTAISLAFLSLSANIWLK